jgi:excinuclease ABC subunit C
LSLSDLPQSLSNKISKLPGSPGVYKYFDKDEQVIYIGKAKNLKKRVSSYFSKKRHENYKTSVLVKRIANVRHIVTPSELEALLLENSLIKEFQPKYNINLKDDKTYPFIRITTDRFPKIFPTRNPVKDGSDYFGPYASVRMMNLVLDLAKKLYPIRNCNLNLSQENIDAGKFRVCLEYHIGNCKGPCEGHQSESDYMESVQQIKHLLRGNLKEVKQHLLEQMNESAEALKFEDAQRYKERLEWLEQYQSRSTVVNPNYKDMHVFQLYDAGKIAFVNHMKVSRGIIIQSKNFEFKKQLNETKEDLLELAIGDVLNKEPTSDFEVVVPFPVELDQDDVELVYPKGGDRKKLLTISFKNLSLYAREKLKQYDQLDPEFKVNRLMDQMKKDLKLKEQPRHIECFDNSNFQGTNAVAACVVFKNGKPAKKEYRHFNIKTVEGPDDFASMREVVYRRYSRLVKEEQPLPQLVLIDGGKGQLSASVEALKKAGVYDKLAVIGIAKRLEEIYYPEDPIPLHIDKRSETLKILQQLRDEAHRFGITHHRNKRSKNTFVSELTQIKGIGKETATDLLSHFKSVRKIKNASQAELEAIVGSAKAKIIVNAFQRP